MKVRELINKLIEEPMDNEVMVQMEKPWADRPVRYELTKVGRACRQSHRTYVAIEVTSRDE